MGDAGEGLIDADTRLQERMDELEEERKAARNKRPQEDPERARQRESLKLARTELQQQLERTEHPARRTQIGQAVGEIDKRLAVLDAPPAKVDDKKKKK
jgi:glutathione S-transferase